MCMLKVCINNVYRQVHYTGSSKPTTDFYFMAQHLTKYTYNVHVVPRLHTCTRCNRLLSLLAHVMFLSCEGEQLISSYLTAPICISTQRQMDTITTKTNQYES